jgi:hypothetical protein
MKMKISKSKSSNMSGRPAGRAVFRNGSQDSSEGDSEWDNMEQALAEQIVREVYGGDQYEAAALVKIEAISNHIDHHCIEEIISCCRRKSAKVRFFSDISGRIAVPILLYILGLPGIVVLVLWAPFFIG